jgi:RNase P/RNase MRP subunit POP5
MVRFKNRYFLVELVPFKIENDPFRQETTRYHKNIGNDTVNLKNDSLPPFTSASVSSYIRTAVTLNYGQYANSSLLQSLSVKYSNNSTNMIILRVPRDFHAQIWAALTLMTEWPAENQTLTDGIKCTWRTVHCAGTIRSCQKAAISFARKCLIQSIPEGKSLKIFSTEVIEPLAKKIKSIEP